MSEASLEHLDKLVAFNTSNPPRTIAGDEGIFDYAEQVLKNAGFTTTVEDRDR